MAVAFSMPSNISNGFFTSFHDYIILYLDLFVKLLFQEQYNFMKGVFLYAKDRPYIMQCTQPVFGYSLCRIIRSCGFENAHFFLLSTYTVYHTIPAFSCHKFVTNLPKTATKKKLSTISGQKYQCTLYRYRSRTKHHARQYF